MKKKDSDPDYVPLSCDESSSEDDSTTKSEKEYSDLEEELNEIIVHDDDDDNDDDDNDDDDDDHDDYGEDEDEDEDDDDEEDEDDDDEEDDDEEDEDEEDSNMQNIMLIIKNHNQGSRKKKDSSPFHITRKRKRKTTKNKHHKKKKGKYDDILKEYSETEKHYFESMSDTEKDNILSLEVDLNKDSFNEKEPLRFKFLKYDVSQPVKNIILSKLEQSNKMTPSSGEYCKLHNWLTTLSKIPIGKYHTQSVKYTDVDIAKYLQNIKKSIDDNIFGRIFPT